MAWMSEAEYELKQDCMDKKITARSARSTRTHCGKSGAVKFPSDYLSKKEIDAMNGKCETYRLNAPMSWDEFKSMPKDLQKDYIKALRKTYNVPNNALAEMFGVTGPCVAKYFTGLGLNLGKGSASSKRVWNKESFLAWRGGASAGAVDETPVEEDEYADVDQDIYYDELIAVNEDAEIQTNPHEIADKLVHDIESAIPQDTIRKAAEFLNETWNDMTKDNDENVTDETAHICDNPYHYLPVIPSTGTMTFVNNRADDILGTIKSILCDSRVNVTISWEFVSGE